MTYGLASNGRVVRFVGALVPATVPIKSSIRATELMSCRSERTGRSTGQPRLCSSWRWDGADLTAVSGS